MARVFQNPGTRPDPKNFTRPDDTFLKPEPARVWFSKPAGTRGFRNLMTFDKNKAKLQRFDDETIKNWSTKDWSWNEEFLGWNANWLKKYPIFCWFAKGKIIYLLLFKAAQKYFCMPGKVQHTAIGLKHWNTGLSHSNKANFSKPENLEKTRSKYPGFERWFRAWTRKTRSSQNPNPQNPKPEKSSPEPPLMGSSVSLQVRQGVMISRCLASCAFILFIHWGYHG